MAAIMVLLQKLNALIGVADLMCVHTDSFLMVNSCI